MSKLLKDGGYASRKFWLTVGIIVTIVLMGLLAALHPVFSPNLDTVVGGLLGALGLYLTGNVGAKYAIGKTTAKPKTEPPVEPEPPEGE